MAPSRCPDQGAGWVGKPRREPWGRSLTVGCRRLSGISGSFERTVQIVQPAMGPSRCWIGPLPPNFGAGRDRAGAATSPTACRDRLAGPVGPGWVRQTDVGAAGVPAQPERTIPRPFSHVLHRALHDGRHRGPRCGLTGRRTLLASRTVPDGPPACRCWASTNRALPSSSMGHVRIEETQGPP